MRLDDLTWPDVGAAADTGTPLILPLGSLEQHGPHLPFDTDTVCVQALADGGAEGAGAISLPALSYGAPSRPRSGGGPGFPLGAEIPFGTYFDVVRGIVANLLVNGTSNLLVLSWHTENAPVIYDAVREAASLAHAESAKIVVLDTPGPPRRPRDRAEGIRGRTGTGRVRARRPDRDLGDAGTGPRARARVLRGRGIAAQAPLRRGADACRHVAPSGSFTSPRNATAEIGQMLLDDLLPGMAKLISTEFGDRRSDAASR